MDKLFKCSDCSFSSIFPKAVHNHVQRNHNSLAGVIEDQGASAKQEVGSKRQMEQEAPQPAKRQRNPSKQQDAQLEVLQRTAVSIQNLGESIKGLSQSQNETLGAILDMMRQAVTEDQTTQGQVVEAQPPAAGGGGSHIILSSSDSSDDDDDDGTVIGSGQVAKINGVKKPPQKYLGVRQRQSYITRSLLACIAMGVDSIFEKGLSKRANELMVFLGLDPSIDVTPKCKDLLAKIESKLKIAMTIHNRNRKIIWSGEVFDDYLQLALVWHNRSWYWVKSVDHFLSMFSCPGCSQIIEHQNNIDRHKSNCPGFKHYQETGECQANIDQRKEVVMTGIWRSNSRNLLTDINTLTNLHLTVKDLSQEHLAVFDCESALMRPGDIFGGFPENTRLTAYVANHQLFCIGTCSSVPGFKDVEVFVRKAHGEKQFAKEFVLYLLEMADMSYSFMRAKLQPVFNRLNDLLRWYKRLKSKPWVVRIRKMKRRLDDYCKQLIVGGYNIFRYDLTLLKREGILDLLNELDGPVHIMKRRKGTYLTIVSQRLKFVDQINYTGKISMRELLKEYGFGLSKSYFPYNKIQTLEDLNQGFPKYEDFYDTLHGCNSLHYDYLVYKDKIKAGQSKASVLKEMGVTEPPKKGSEVYNELVEIWLKNGCKTLFDIAMYYLRLDLVPLLQFMLKHRELFLDEGVDLYSQYLSMSHFSYQYAHSFVDPMVHFFCHIPLTQRQKLQEFLIGGLSIVFRRLAEPRMAIRPTERADGEPISKIRGIDVSNLYGWSFAQDQSYGFFVLRKAEDDFQPLYMGEKFSESIEWLNYCSQLVYKTEIRTQWSEEGEQRVFVPIDNGDDDESSSDDNSSSDSDASTSGGAKVGFISLVHGNLHSVRVFKRVKKKFKSFKLDGFFLDENRKKWGLEYLGEWAHGFCEDHRTPENDNQLLVGGKTSRQLRESTFKRLKMVKSVLDYLVIIYDCQWKKLRKENPEIRAFVSKFTFGPKIKKKVLSQEEALQQVVDHDIRGFAEVDAVVPMELRNPLGLADFPPIIKNCEISRENISGYGKVYAEKYGLLQKPIRTLIASYFCNKTYLSTDYIAFLDSLGVKITHIHEIMQFQQGDMFRSFVLRTTTERVEADKKGLKNLAKLKKDEINSSYGSSLLNSSKLINTKLVLEKELLKTIGQNHFIDAEACGFEDQSSIWEMVTRKRTIKYYNLITVGFNILQLSKILILDYYYNHMKRFIPSKCFQLLNGDTDSFYFAHSRDSVRDCVPQHLLTEYDKSCKKWHVDEADAYSKRCPGKFHTEFEGTHLVALGPKLYCCKNEITGAKKLAHRGIQSKQRGNIDLLKYDTFKDVLLEQDNHLPTVKMTGFVDKIGQMITYIGRRTNLHAGYFKMFIESDLFSVKPFDNLYVNAAFLCALAIAVLNDPLIFYFNFMYIAGEKKTKKKSKKHGKRHSE